MFTQAVADIICERLAKGESLRSICADEGMPHESTVRLWVVNGGEFATQYARAREIGYEMLADEILEISDTPLLGVETKIKSDGTRETTEGDMLGHRRLQVDSRKWMLAKMLPKKYGDKLDLNHSGRIAVAQEMSDDELARIAASGGS